MGKLFTFLENFDTENLIRIYDKDGNELYSGKMGDVPQRITNMMSVVRGTAIWKDNCLEVKVIKS